MEEKLPLYVKLFETTVKKKRSSLFENEIFYRVTSDLNIYIEGRTDKSYTTYFLTHNEFGIVEYYPTGDKIHIHRDGGYGYKPNGLRWIFQNAKYIQ